MHIFLIVTGLLLPCAVIAEEIYVPDTVYMLHSFDKDYLSSYLYSAAGERVWKFTGVATVSYRSGRITDSELSGLVTIQIPFGRTLPCWR